MVELGCTLQGVLGSGVQKGITLFCPIISRYDTGWVFSCIPFDDTIKIEIAVVFIVQRRKIRLREVKIFIQSKAADGASLQSVFVSKIRAFICLQIHSYFILTPLGAASVSTE